MLRRAQVLASLREKGPNFPCSYHFTIASLPCHDCPLLFMADFSSTSSHHRNQTGFTVVMVQTKSVQGTVHWRAGLHTAL